MLMIIMSNFLVRLTKMMRGCHERIFEKVSSSVRVERRDWSTRGVAVVTKNGEDLSDKFHGNLHSFSCGRD